MQAWLTLPSCLASSSSPSLARMIFCSRVNFSPGSSVPEGRVVVTDRGENRAPPPASTAKTNNACQIKFELLQPEHTNSTPDISPAKEDARLCMRGAQPTPATQTTKRNAHQSPRDDSTITIRAAPSGRTISRLKLLALRIVLPPDLGGIAAVRRHARIHRFSSGCLSRVLMPPISSHMANAWRSCLVQRR